MLLRQMWRHKKVAEVWCISEGVYLPKEADAKEIGDFRIYPQCGWQNILWNNCVESDFLCTG